MFFTDTYVYYSYYVIRHSPRSSFINTAQRTIILTNNQGEDRTYNYELAGGELIVKKFADNEDMTFVRREGSKKTGIEDLWIPQDLSSTNQWTYFFLIRETGSGNDILHNFKIGDWWNMDTYKYDSANKDIRWDNISSAPTSFSIDENGKLHISLPKLTYYDGEEIVFSPTTWF